MPVARYNAELAALYMAELQKKFLPDRVWDANAVHRSDLVFCLTKAYYRYTLHEERHSEELLMYFLRGQVLHEMLVIGEPEVAVPWNGITMHVDDVVTMGNTVAYVEKKTTNIKFVEPPDVGYRVEVKYNKKGEVTSTKEQGHPQWGLELAYAAAHHPEHKANFFVLHLMGDYATRRAPMISGPWEYTFSDEECEIAREWFAARRDILVDAMQTGVPPPVKYRMAWECNDCPFLPECAEALSRPDATPIPIPGIFKEEE